MRISMKNEETTSIFHWATKYKDPKSIENSPIKHRKISITASDIKDCAKLTLAYDLVMGKGPRALQKSFNESAAKNLKSFDAVNPDFTLPEMGPKSKKG
jgi:hypothetical protein